MANNTLDSLPFRRKGEGAYKIFLNFRLGSNSRFLIQQIRALSVMLRSCPHVLKVLIRSCTFSVRYILDNTNVADTVTFEPRNAGSSY